MKFLLRMRLWVSAAIIAIIVLVTFMLSVPHTRDAQMEKAVVETAPVPAVTIRDVFKKGVHTLSGSLEVPNACTQVQVQATLLGEASSTQTIAVALTSDIDTGVCLQVPTKASFQTTLTAPAKLPIEVTVNGEVASTTAL
jgi:hypothetical protein